MKVKEVLVKIKNKAIGIPTSFKQRLKKPVTCGKKKAKKANAKISKFLSDRKIKRWSRYILFALILIYLVQGNYENIMNIEIPEGNELKYKIVLEQVILTKTNVQVLAFGSIYVMTTILIILIRIPFSRVEHLKIFGLEYKLQAETQKEIAEKEVYNIRTRGDARLQFLETFEDLDVQEEFYKSILNEYSFEVEHTSELLATTIEDFFMKYLRIELQCGVLLVRNNRIDDELLNKESPLVRKLVKDVMTERNYVLTNQALAVPLVTDDPSGPWCILHIRSVDQEVMFTEADCLMVKLAWIRIKNIIYARVLEQILEYRDAKVIE